MQKLDEAARLLLGIVVLAVACSAGSGNSSQQQAQPSQQQQQPPPPPPPQVVSLLPDSLLLQQGRIGTFALKISALQPTPTEVLLSNDQPMRVWAPTSVMVPANQTEIFFNVTGLAVGTAILMASLNGSTVSVTGKVTSPPPPPPPPPPPTSQVVSLVPNPLSLQQGATDLLFLTIDSAQLTDTVVTLTNDQPSLVQAPPSVTVLAGQTQTAVSVTGLSTGNAILTASLNGSNASATVEVTAPPSSGPLRVLASNRRYFTDGTGKAIYLTGSHTWGNLQDNGTTDPPPPFDYTAYLDWLQQHHHNFIRLWAWEQANFTNEISGGYFFQPNVYQRTGPDIALDGKPKFDVTLFNQAYFDRLRQRVIEAGTRGMYVSVMLFEGWSIEPQKGSFALDNPWKGHPYNPNNNVNGINGDPNGDDSGAEVHTLAVPAVTALQKAYIEKVVDTVNDLDNVLYEISNESHSNSQNWQYAMIDHIKSYEATKPKQHPVGMTVEDPAGNNDELFNSPADWISPNNATGDYLNNPPVATGDKVILSDTDHLCGVCGNSAWPWKIFTRGINPIYMDVYDGAAIGLGANGFDPDSLTFVETRKQMGYTLLYANRMNLAAMTPQPLLCSTGYCLARNVPSGAEFLVYLPGGGAVTVDLSAVTGMLNVEWFDTSIGQAQSMSPIMGGSAHVFTPPFGGDAVLYLHP